jgi:hypothetical protein
MSDHQTSERSPNTAEGLQAGEFMVLRQTLGGNHRAGAGLLATMPGLLVMRDRMVWQNLAETGPGVGQQRVLIGPAAHSAAGQARKLLSSG